MEDQEGKVEKEQTWQDRVNKYGKKPSDKKPSVDPTKAITIIIQIIIVLLAIFFLRSCFTDSPEKEQERADKAAARAEISCKDTSSAFVMSQHFVKQQLKSPSSAKFPSSPVKAEYLGNCKTLIVASFDSQNGFGAMIRGSYVVEMTYHKSSDNWSASNLVIE